jgi:hypothetical protein
MRSHKPRLGWLLPDDRRWLFFHSTDDYMKNCILFFFFTLDLQQQFNPQKYLTLLLAAIAI